MRFLADTHIWYRWRSDPKKLSRAQSRVLTLAERRGETVGVSAISLWELAMMASTGKVRIGQPLESWIETMMDDPQIEVLPLTPAIAAAAVALTGLPTDPADRMIAASALCHKLTLLTADQRIIDWGRVSVL